MITLKTVRRTGWLCVAGAIVLCAFIPPMARAQWAQSRAAFEAVAVSLRNDANPASGRLGL